MALLMTVTANPNIQLISGTVSIRTTTVLSSGHAQAGATWQGSLADDVIRDGHVLAVRGTPVQGLIEEVRRKGEGRGAELALRLADIGAATGAGIGAIRAATASQARGRGYG